LFDDYFPKIEKLKKETDEDPYEELVSWFFEESGFVLEDHLNDADYRARLNNIMPLDLLIKKYQPNISEEDIFFVGCS